MEVLPPDPLNQVRSQSEYRRSLWRSMFQDIRIGIGGGAEGLLAEMVCLLSGPFLPCLTILLSDLIFYHDGASVSSHRSHDYATSVKLSSTSSALGHFGYRLIACPPFFHATWFYIHDSPGRYLENLSNPTIPSNLARSPWCCSTSPTTLLNSYVQRQSPLQSKPPKVAKGRSCATGLKRCMCRAWLTDYVAQVS